VAGGNFGTTSIKDDNSVPLAQDNGSMYNLIYTHTSGAWTIEPYLQYQNTPSNKSIGIASSADAWGGALFVDYAFNSNFSLPVRLEYLDTSGGTNLLYGAGSKAWSVTVTPTYQEKIFFARLELSYIAADSSTSEFVFGETGTSTSQARAMLETGVIF
jgi:Putative beta-barrel porin-2, OmpL-like. bbp2